MHKRGTVLCVHYHDYARKIIDRNQCTSVEQFCVCIIMIMHTKKLETGTYAQVWNNFLRALSWLCTQERKRPGPMHKYGKLFCVHYHDYAQKKLETGTYAQVWNIFCVHYHDYAQTKIRDRDLCTSMDIFCVHYHDYAPKTTLEIGTYAQVWNFFGVHYHDFAHTIKRDRNLCTSMENFLCALSWLCTNKLETGTYAQLWEFFLVCIIMILHKKIETGTYSQVWIFCCVHYHDYSQK